MVETIYGPARPIVELLDVERAKRVQQEIRQRCGRHVDVGFLTRLMELNALPVKREPEVVGYFEWCQEQGL